MTGKCVIHSGQSATDVVTFLKGEREVFLVYDRNVTWVADEILAALPELKASLPIHASEEEKTLETAQEIGRWLLGQEASRGALLLAVGGGITTDLVGFAAGIYKRGIRYANLPTTLLAQVDASIGGKTGVNLDGYKNMLGAFRMPEFTFLCPAVLKTLPDREMKAGWAEMLKTFLLSDGEAYGKALQAKDPAPWIEKAALIKADIVSRDPQEQGERAKLNLGHSFGHAIEHEARLRGDDITHGEAVAMGTILAARLAESLGVAEKGLAHRLKADFDSIGLPTECPYPVDALLGAIDKDKKAVSGGKVKFVLPVRPGEVVFQELNPYDLHLASA